jgi:hypothetical protein
MLAYLKYTFSERCPPIPKAELDRNFELRRFDTSIRMRSAARRRTLTTPVAALRHARARTAEGYGVTEKGSDCAADLFDETPSD